MGGFSPMFLSHRLPHTHTDTQTQTHRHTHTHTERERETHADTCMHTGTRGYTCGAGGLDGHLRRRQNRPRAVGRQVCARRARRWWCTEAVGRAARHSEEGLGYPSPAASAHRHRGNAHKPEQMPTRPPGCIRREGPQRPPQRRLDRRLEEVAKPVGNGYCRLQMPLSLALVVRETVAGRRLGAWEGGGGCPPPPLPMHPPPGGPEHMQTKGGGLYKF